MNEQQPTPETPGVQQNTETAQPTLNEGLPQKQTKSRKKTIIVLLAVLLLIAGSAAAWFILKDPDEPTSQQQTVQQSGTVQEESAFSPVVFIENGQKLQYIDGQNEVVDYATLRAEEKLIEAYKDGNTVVATYVVQEATASGGSTYTEYGQFRDGTRQETITLPDSIGTFSNPVLSPDKKTIIVEIGDESDFMQNLTTVNVQDGASQVIHEPTTTKEGFRTLIGWLNNDTVLLQQQTCRQCDGPPLPELYSLNITSGELKLYFNGGDAREDISYAEFRFSADNNKLLMFGGDYSKLFGGEVDRELNPTKLYEIDLATAALREIAQFNSASESLVGISADGDSAFVTTAEWVETDMPNAPYSSVDGNFILDTPTLSRVALQTGAVSEVPVESRLITEGTRYGTVIAADDTITMTVINQPEFTSELYALVRLVFEEDSLTTLLENTFEPGKGAISLLQLVD